MLVLATLVVVALSVGSIQMASAQPSHATAHHAKATKAKGQKHGKRWVQRQYRVAKHIMPWNVVRFPVTCHFPPAYKRLKHIRPYAPKLWGSGYWAVYAEAAFGAGRKAQAKRLARHGWKVVQAEERRGDGYRYSNEGERLILSDIIDGFFEIYWCK